MRLTVHELRHRHAGHLPEVLQGVNLDVSDGEAVAIVGPSGSGKTTLLALLGGLVPVQSGEIRLIDEHGEVHSPFGCVAWVLQTVNVLSDRTVVDNVCLGGYAAGRDRAGAVYDARRWLGTVGLAERAGDPVRVLSGGEVQRVVIARALATSRPVLLADEPTGQLDARTTDSVLHALIDSTHRRTLVVVTHDDTVASRCDRILKLNDGVLC